ncbi:hypothetical protein LENED_000832 [Lentinula edodes]|uniref:Uncharacterized protein n=1 Tax=Lentinula edodes TaxID=5353 RepID=A0A1Q3DWR8_LENED|nr:hypothetical protein LENED_000832 [Lentinula edodes]
MLFYGNIGAWITIDGNGHLEEHGVDVDDREKTVTCYIASEEGKSFQVHCSPTLRMQLRSRKLYDKSHTAPETLEFNEKDVKGSAHNTTFGKPVVDSRSVLEHETEPYGDPIARFRFRYMPIDLLRAKDIAPYPPRKGRLQVDEEELKPHLPIDLTTNDLAPIRVNSLLRNGQAELF